MAWPRGGRGALDWEEIADADGEPSTSGRGPRDHDPAKPATAPSASSHSRTAQELLQQLVPHPPFQSPVPSLRALCIGLLGQHVEPLVTQLGAHLAPLPSEVKAALVCVARRRGVLSNRVLEGLADEGWTMLDLQGATALTERAIRRVLRSCPGIRALDLRGLPPAVAWVGLLRDLPGLCPSLELLAVGGGRAQDDAALDALPDLLPHVRVEPAAGPLEPAAESWEEVAEAGPDALPDAGAQVGLPRLRVLVWPGAPALAHHLVRRLSPRVELAEALPPPPPPAPTAANGQPSQHRAPYASCTDAVQAPYVHPALQQYEDVQRELELRRSRGAASTGGDTSGPAIRVIRAGATAGSRVGGGGGPQAQSQPRPAGSSGGSGTGSSIGQAQGQGQGQGQGQAKGRYQAPHLRDKQVQAQAQAQAGGSRGGEAERAGATEAPGLLDPGQGGPARAPADPGPPPPLPHPAADAGPGHWRQPGPVPPASAAGPLPTSASSTPPGPGPGPAPTAAPTANRQPPPPALDDSLAALVAPSAWADLDGPGGARTGPSAAEELHIAEKFRLAYVEQDARLCAKAAREAALHERRELRESAAARALARWLDAE
ncbi:hypothetical protein HYH03_012822 [Edaphochlamys debaryana]|uniref:Uncharacterized protein n=1 Tax=Edaphochlamys debaryana TaxID=47281 RepID=A0A835XXH1_9CHLO|nr:hypothetical protein HYH03_012822 [Edaphochlamys debaryana]|eukprot:KAG2488660.1 hypothetical protein HYH03_012822 [Edaphochlamys debaryana]